MTTARVADLIIDTLHRLGVGTVFTLTGGGAMYLHDALAVHPKMKTIFNHHEQASAMAAVGYAKLSNGYAAAVTTTGCGATNAITGLLDAWQDGLPVIFISGQVKQKEASYGYRMPLRQLGVQEANIIDIVRPITKHAIMLTKAEDAVMELERAAWIAMQGRRGPVWIDIPLDIQGAMVDLAAITHHEPTRTIFALGRMDADDLAQLHKGLSDAGRPIIIAGNGIRQSSAIWEFRAFLENTKIPFVTSYLGVDVCPNDHPQYVGVLGIKGDRAGNFAVQNADYVLAIGCRLSVSLTGFEYEAFAREATIAVVDIDWLEHCKDTVDIDLPIHSDARHFLTTFKPPVREVWKMWGDTCRRWREKWPLWDVGRANSEPAINTYHFIDCLMRHLKPDSVIVSDAGSAFYVTSQAFKPRYGQRYLTSGGQAEMGFTLPAAIGAWAARRDRGDENCTIIGITGDGSFHTNAQELAVIEHHKMPIKIIVWNNGGYLSIRSTQRRYFDGREFGTDPKSGVPLPEVWKIGEAYNVPVGLAPDARSIDAVLKAFLVQPAGAILDVRCPPNQEIIPAASSQRLSDGRMVSKPLEDMYPFLDREEFLAEMIVNPLE